MFRLKILALLALVVLVVACGGGESGMMEVEDVSANLTLPTSTGAVYMTISNGTGSDDALIDAAVPGCGTVELHTMTMENDVMVMRQMEGNRIPLPAGETVMLKRGGLHVMCIDKTGDYAVGDSVPVTLTFEKAGVMEVEAVVVEPGEMSPGMGDHNMSGEHSMDGMDHGND